VAALYLDSFPPRRSSDLRVDILERLADLIRPALGWKEGVGVRPDGAYGDGAFIVTPAMMSILGATAEDMEEILKGLGYRGEAKPAAEVAGRIASLDATARAAAQAQAAEPAAQDHGDAMADPNVPGAPEAASPSHDEVMADSNVSPAPAPADETVPAEAPARTATEAPDAAAATSAGPAPAASPDATEAGMAQADAGSAAEEAPKP